MRIHTVMKRIILIDGYNLIFHFPEIRKRMEMDLEQARNEFVNLLSHTVDPDRERIIIFFDGDDRVDDFPERDDRIQVIFSKKPEEADPLIERWIERDPESIALVVSSDAEIESFARMHNVKTSSSKRYAYHVLRVLSPPLDQKYNESLSDDEIEKWMQIFRTDGKNKHD